jgi:pre-mRNA-splicing factor CWC22
MSSLEFEECCHKLLKLNIPEGQEIELCNMVVECCSQEKTYIKFYGLLSQRLCLLNPIWVHFFELCWTQIYTTIHRVETNRLRNMAKLFAYLLATDALPWSCLSVIHLNESETTSASRVFIKIVFMELTAELSIPTLQQKLSDPELQPFLTGLFPKDNLRNTRFAINFFTAIQLGPLT